jgi:hypothetical protein
MREEWVSTGRDNSVIAVRPNGVHSRDRVGMGPP